MNNLNKDKVQTIDAYIALQPKATQARLQQLRELIKSVVPQAEETISYNMPAFKYHGILVGFAAWKKHLGFYPWNGHTVQEFASELEGFSTSSGAIQLPFAEKLPVALIKKIVIKRTIENLSTTKTKKQS